MNNIELITNYSPKAWDTVYKQESMSSLLDADSRMVRFEGAKTVKIAKFQSGGLHDYYRNNNANGYGDTRVPEVPASGTDFVGSAGFGYQKSSMRLVWEEFTLKCDRAAAFQVEMFDNEESGEQLVGLGVTEISRTVIVPEVDAYCFSKIAEYCDTGLGNLVEQKIVANGTLNTGEAKPIAALNAAFLYFANHEVPVQDQLIFASPEFVNAMRETDEVTKFLGQADFGENKDVKFQIYSYQGRKIVEVSPERLRTKILLGAEGFTWGTGSMAINFLAVSKSAVIHVVKYEKVKVIGEDLNLAGNGFDGYTIYARIYHDVFVPDNKRYAIYCSVDSGAAPAAQLSLLAKAGKITGITTYPGEKIALVFKAAAGGTIGGALSSLTTPVYTNVGDTVDASKNYYSVIDGKIAAILAPVTAGTPSADHKVKVELPISGISYYSIAAASAPTAVAGSYTDISTGGTVTVTLDDTNATYIVAHDGTTFLGAVKVGDAY